MKKLNRIKGLPKSHEITWWVCRILLFVWGVWGMLHGYTSEFIQACFAIIFTHLWDMFQLFGGKSFITKVPYSIQTMLNIFICFSCVVGTTINTRTDFTGIDVPEHIFAGYIACMGGFFLADIMQGKKEPIKISVHAMFSLCFSVTLLVGWEFYEFTMDRLYGFVMQHGNEPLAEGLTDTMVDLILGSVGALAAMFIGAFERVGIIGKNKAAIRAEYKAKREEFKKEKERLYRLQNDDEIRN
ncbi:MAG: hypothetical protein NC122_03995 [Faecalibacterium sp.]|nr:hypothetical protein [Ruminococcus sp.]MCM1391739.1 hypothetical protein [Ruminococcus sp.]MCM1485348.1 hypothetical protein [Faecalibacterium sp.]